MKIIVFDFDKTLTYFDTWNDFLIFTGRKRKFFHIKYCFYIIFLCLRKFKFISNLNLKKISISIFLKGIKIERLHEIAKEFAGVIKMNQIYIKQFQQQKKDANQEIIIVSASLQVYIQYIFPHLQVIASELMIKSDKVIGLKTHIYGIEKKYILIQKGYSVLDEIFTDSVSDLPIVEISNKINLVSNDNIIDCLTIQDFKQKYYSLEKPKYSFLKLLTAKYRNI